MTPAYFALAQAAIARGDTTTARQHLQAYRRHVAPEEGDSDDQGAALTSLRGALQLVYGDSTQRAEVVRQFAAGAYASGGGSSGERCSAIPRPRRFVLSSRSATCSSSGTASTPSAPSPGSGPDATIRSAALSGTRRLSLPRRGCLASRPPRGLSVARRWNPRRFPPTWPPPCVRRTPPLLYRLMGCYRQARLTMMQARDSSTVQASDSATQPADPAQNAHRLLQDVPCFT